MQGVEGQERSHGSLHAAAFAIAEAYRGFRGEKLAQHLPARTTGAYWIGRVRSRYGDGGKIPFSHAYRFYQGASFRADR